MGRDPPGRGGGGVNAELFEQAVITPAGSIRYRCAACRSDHWHGLGEDEREGDVVHRVSHCHLAPGEGVVLLLAADEREAVAA
jgi:hypothetical protein